MIKRIHMYDLDGLAINSLHRYKTKGKNIDLDYWRENDTPEKIAQDSLMPMAYHIQESIANPEIYVIIATARTCFENDANYDFLNLHFSGYNKFIHREIDDNRGGAEIKIKGMKRFLGLKQFKNAKFHVYEDNHKYLAAVCYAMRDFGFSTVGHFNPSYQGH